MTKTLLTFAMATLLAGCDGGTSTGSSQAPASTPPSAAQPIDSSIRDQWIGRWIGIEGLNLTISKDETMGKGHYILRMQYGLDAAQSGTYKGQAGREGIIFNREDGPQLLRSGDGEATGLKWLADKKKCLIVKLGEGYCRS